MSELLPFELSGQAAEPTLRITALKPIVEAAIFASHQPLTLEQLTGLFEEQARPSHTELAQTLEALSIDCDARGVELVEVASGFRFQVKAAMHAQISRLWTERQSKYSRALLETLALIAYRQPITRAEIEAVRGVAVSSHIIRTLEEREWIRVVGHREVPGRPALFSTTRAFLDYFKLKSLEDLPTLSEIRDFENSEPEFDFDVQSLALAAPVEAEKSESQAVNVETASAESSEFEPGESVPYAGNIAESESSDSDSSELIAGEPTESKIESESESEPPAEHAKTAFASEQPDAGAPDAQSDAPNV